MSYHDPEWKWLIPFARWLRRSRAGQAFKFGAKWHEDGRGLFSAEQAAVMLYPHDHDLQSAFIAGAGVYPRGVRPFGEGQR